MSSTTLEKYQARHPSEKDAIARLAQLFTGSIVRHFTLDQLADKVEAKSRDELSIVLGELAAAGLVGFELQVNAPGTKKRLAGFKTLKDIPSTIHDTSTDTDVVVKLDDVRPIYAVPATPQR